MAWTSHNDRDQLADELSGLGVIAAPVLDAVEMSEQKSLVARGVVVDVNHPETGPWTQAGSPFHFSSVENPAIRPAPLLGEHTEEVLAELLGTTHEEYARLVADGVSGMGPPEGEETE